MSTSVARTSSRSLGLFLFAFCVCCFSIWLVYRSIHPLLPQPEEAPRFYSNQTQNDLRLTLIDAIGRAQQSIFLVMFGLSDPPVLDALYQASRKAIDTTIYYDPTGSPHLRPYLNQSRVIPVHQNALMHQKILVLDRDLVFIGSANMTTSSLRMHDNLLIGFRSRRVADFLIKNAPHCSGTLKTTIGGQSLELYLLPDPRGHALSELRHHLRHAKTSLRLALFTFTHPLLIDELIAAKQRGVRVRVVIDLHSGQGASAKAVNRLRQAGVKVTFSQGIQLLHHKFVLIDEQCLISGSANWTKAAFTKNNDCLLILPQLTAEQKAVMKQLWRKIETESKAPAM